MTQRQANTITKIRVVCKNNDYYIKIKVKGNLFWKWVDNYSLPNMGINTDRPITAWNSENGALKDAEELSEFVSASKIKLGEHRNRVVADIDIKTLEKDPEHFV